MTTPDPTPEVPGINVSMPEATRIYRHTEAQPVDRNWTAPIGGPGYDESVPIEREARHELTTGYHRETWSEDHMTGLHGVIAYPEAPHYGYTEGWGVETTIPRMSPEEPWDAGAMVPLRYQQEGF